MKTVRFITFHPPEWTSSKSLQSMGPAKQEPPSCSAGNADSQQSLWGTAWRFLENLKMQICYDPAFPHWTVHPDQTVVGKDTCTQLSLQLCFQEPKLRSNQNVPGVMKGKRGCGTHIQGNVTQPSKSMKLCHFQQQRRT